MKIIDLIQSLKELQLSAEFSHWITRSEPRHRALEKLYTELRDETDKLVECSIGSGFIGPVSSFHSTHINLDLDNSIEDLISRNLDLLKRGAKQLSDQEELQDIIYDIMNLLNKTMYILTLS